jgi:hypothetical protein
MKNLSKGMLSWLAILLLAVVVHLLMSKAVLMIIEGNKTGETILFVVALLAAVAIKSELSGLYEGIFNKKPKKQS